MMLFPAYVVHVIEGRVRFRHPALGTAAGRAKALAVLEAQSLVKEVRQGRESLLVFLDQPESTESTVLALCKALEEALPAIRRDVSGLLPQLLPGVSPRKLENRALIAALGVSTALGFMGSEKAHVFTAAAFGVLVAHHVWTRRGAL